MTNEKAESQRKLKKNDFIELEFTGRDEDGEVFDSNIKEDLEKTNLTVNAKPFIYALDTGMFLKGVDDSLIGKEPGKFKIELTAENAFGLRKPELINLMPAKLFKEQNINPIQGATLNFDGRIGKIISNSAGRIRVDFNNPMAGKNVVYDLNVKRVLSDTPEKVKALNEFLFRKDFEFEIKEDKLIMKVEKTFLDFVKMFNEKFKEVLGLDLEVLEKLEEAKPEKNKMEETMKTSIGGVEEAVEENIEKK